MRRLQRLRLEKFLTQQQLADQVGVDLNTVQRWEAGDRFPWPRFLQKLCEVLGVGTADLVEADEWPARRPGKEAAAAIA
jgi:transcriptional regulator with XRE-family HTH domain